MSWIRDNLLSVRRKPPSFLEKQPTSNRQPIAASASTTTTRESTGVPDAAVLREWGETNPFIFAAISARRSQVANADWDILPINPRQNYSRKIQAQIKALLTAPNPKGKNNSFGSLIEPVIGDVLTLDIGAILKIATLAGKLKDEEALRGPIGALRHIDAAKVSFIPGWETKDDGPRYEYRVGEGWGGKKIPLENDELITIVGNPTTWGEHGVAPLRVLYETLRADQDTFRSVHMLQKKRSPTGMVIIPDADAQTIEHVSRLFEAHLESKSGVGFFNIADAKFIPLGSTNIMQQGVEWFYDLLVRRICAAFRISPITIGWSQDVNRAGSAAQLRINEDVGLVPLLKLIAGYINREIVAEFGDSNLQFLFTELVPEDEATEPAAIRELVGQGIAIPSLNEARIAAGFTPRTTSGDDALSASEIAWYTEPLVVHGELGLVPISIKAEIIDKMTRLIEAQVKTAELGVEAAKNPQAGQTPPKQRVSSRETGGTTPTETQLASEMEEIPDDAEEVPSHPFEEEFNKIWDQDRSPK